MKFLKNLFKKKQSAETVSLEELPAWFAKKAEPIFAEIKENVEEQLDEAEKEKDQMENGLINLRKSRLANPNVSGRELQIMEGNRDLYIKKAMDLLNNIELSDEISYDSIMRHCSDFEREFVEFSKGTARAFYILDQFFGNEMKSIAQNLSDIEQIERKIKEIVDNPNGLKLLKDLQDSISELHKLDSLQSRLLNQLTEEDSRLLGQKAHLQKLEKQKDDLENSEEYENLGGLRTARVKLEKELESNRSALADLFYQLEKAFRKYQRIVDERSAEIIERCLKNPTEELFEKNDLSILHLANSMKINLENIEADERRRAKVRELLERLDENFISERSNRDKELLSKLHDIDSRIKQSKIIMELEDISYKIQHSRGQIKRIEDEEIRRLNAQLDKLDPEKLKQRICAQAEKIMDIKVTIANGTSN